MRYAKVILLCVGSIAIFHLTRRLPSLYLPRNSFELACLAAIYYLILCTTLTLVIRKRNIRVPARLCPPAVWLGIYTLCYVFALIGPYPVMNTVVYTINGLGEEFVFRLFLFNALAMYVPSAWAGLLSALVFGAAHVNPLGSVTDLTYFGYTALGGLLLWRLYLGYRSVVVAGAFHTFANVILTNVPHSFETYCSF